MNRRAWLVGMVTVVLAAGGWVAAGTVVTLPISEPIRAVQYFQTDANLRTFWNNLDLEQLTSDFDRLRDGGFNAVILMIPWGEFQTAMDPITYNEQAMALLHRIIAEAQRRGMWVVLRMGSHEMIPHGAQGGNWWAGAVLTNDREFAAYQQLFERIAAETQSYDRMIYFWSWEDVYLWPQPWYARLEDNRAAWRAWCQRRNPSLEFWNVRWGEQHTDWSEVEIPDSRHYAGGAKVGDFWAFVDEYILLRAPDLAVALRRGNPRAVIGFEARIDPDDTYHHRATFAALDDYDFVASWYYPYQGVPLTHVAPLRDARQALQELGVQLHVVGAWSRRPVFFEQIGAALRPEDPAHQRAFLTIAADFLGSTAMGYGIWAWQDYILNGLYNPGFEVGLTGWHTEGSIEIVSEPEAIAHGTRAVRMAPGATVQQTFSGHGGSFCSIRARAERFESTPVTVTLERFLDDRLSDQHEQTFHVGPVYQLYEMAWSSTANANSARLTLRTASESTAAVMIDDVRCYSMVSHLGICDMWGAARQPLWEELTSINHRRSGWPLQWQLQYTWWRLGHALGRLKTRAEESRAPGEGT